MKRSSLILYLLRLIPLLAAVLVSILEISLSSAAGTEKIAVSLLCGNFLLGLYPSSYEGKALSFWFDVVSLPVFAVVAVSGARHGCQEEALLVSGTVISIAYASVRTALKYSRIKGLFRNKAVWDSIEDYSRLFRTVVCLSLAIVVSCLEKMSAGPIVGILSVLVAAAVLAGQFFSVWSGECVLFSKRKSLAIKAVINGNLRTDPPVSEDEDVRMSRLYAKIVRYMEEKKPFLDDNFGIQDLSMSMFTNRTYLSRVINYYSGRNFKQFVNYFRVKYSVELMKKDLRLSVTELATMSGFHSVVTYNMAFRLNMDDTPANYKKQINLGGL